MKRSLTIVTKEENCTCLGIFATICELAIIAGSCWVIVQSQKQAPQVTSCGQLSSVLKLFIFYYGCDLFATLVVFTCGYKCGILYLLLFLGLTIPFVYIWAIYVCFQNR